MLQALQDGCALFGHYLAGFGLIGIGTFVCVKGNVEIEGLGISIQGLFARGTGLFFVILGFLIVALGPFEWCGP